MFEQYELRVYMLDLSLTPGYAELFAQKHSLNLDFWNYPSCWAHCNSAAIYSTILFHFNPLLFIKKWLFISSEGFSALKKMSWYVLKGQCCPSSRLWQPSAESYSRVPHFFKIWTCWVRHDSPLQIVMDVWRASNFKKVRQKAIAICRGGLSHPTRLLSRIEGRALKAVQSLWGLISRPILQKVQKSA